MIITFNELRRIKDRLPSGSSQRIADELGLDVETVRNYFGGKHFDAHVKDGDRIHKGDKLITFDKEAVIKAGYDVTTPMVVCNSEDYNTIRIVVNDVVSAGEKAIVINGKGREE
jgi:phosphotransferase system IIA component